MPRNCGTYGCRQLSELVCCYTSPILFGFITREKFVLGLAPTFISSRNCCHSFDVTFCAIFTPCDNSTFVHPHSKTTANSVKQNIIHVSSLNHSFVWQSQSYSRLWITVHHGNNSLYIFQTAVLFLTFSNIWWLISVWNTTTLFQKRCVAVLHNKFLLLLWWSFYCDFQISLIYEMGML